MDISSLVKQITNEVIKQIGDVPETKSSYFQAKSGTVSSALIVINSNLKNLNEIYQQIMNLKNRYDIGVLLSQTASRVIGKNEIMNKTGISNVYEDGSGRIESLFNYDCVILPNLTVSTLSKIANMINESCMTDIVINALMNKKPVYIGLDFLRYLMSINPTATTTIREYINKLKRMGAMEISFAQLGKINLGSNPAGTYSGSASVKSSDFQNLASAGADRIGSSPEFMIEVPAEVANLIDHTLLKPDVTKDKIIKLCQEAKQYNFASVCVNPGWVKLSAELLQDCPVKVCTVIGFPLGATTSAVKAAETREAVQNGADEIDMVINIGALKTGDNDLVYNDIKAVVDAAQGKVVKVIIETTLLTDEEKVTACKLSKAAGADYVKTSTGFAGGGATIADIALMRSIVGPDIGVKASGGVNDFRQAKNMLEVGATRIGASAGIAIISGGKGTGAY